MNCPSQIYNNVDESGMPLDPKEPNIIAATGTKKFATNVLVGITVVARGNVRGQNELCVDQWGSSWYNVQ